MGYAIPNAPWVHEGLVRELASMEYLLFYGWIGAKGGRRQSEKMAKKGRKRVCVLFTS